MANPGIAYCGIDCDACTYREQTGCRGCRASGGKLFWGECSLAKTPNMATRARASATWKP